MHAGVSTYGSVYTAQAPTSGPAPSAFGVYKVGDEVEIWSKSNHVWCRGRIDRAEGTLVSITYKSPDGNKICKVMPNGDESIRLVHQSSPVTQPPPMSHFSPSQPSA